MVADPPLLGRLIFFALAKVVGQPGQQFLWALSCKIVSGELRGLGRAEVRSNLIGASSGEGRVVLAQNADPMGRTMGRNGTA